MDKMAMPTLKQLLPASPGRRRGTKPADLRPDMISGPMDDFRHTVHVGRGGDAFGDTSFLSELPPGNLPGSPATVIRAPSPKPGLLAWTLRPGKRLGGAGGIVSVGVGGSASLVRSRSRENSPAPGVSPIIKNAFSLPLLTTTTAISGLNPLERASSRSAASSPFRVFPTTCRSAMSHTLPRHTPADHSTDTGQTETRQRGNGECQDSYKVKEIERGSGIGRNAIDFSTAQMKHADSVLSFNLDLGPSMLNDVLRVMDTAELQPSMCNADQLCDLSTPTSDNREQIDSSFRGQSKTNAEYFVQELSSEEPACNRSLRKFEKHNDAPAEANMVGVEHQPSCIAGCEESFGKHEEVFVSRDMEEEETEESKEIQYGVAEGVKDAYGVEEREEFEYVNEAARATEHEEEEDDEIPL